jgi:molybdate transport system substrate-binding protein
MMTGSRSFLPFAVAVGLAGVMASGTPSARSAAEPLVFAAASLKTALDEVQNACRQATGQAFRASYAASSALARQIEAGAPADIFISADIDWMHYLAARDLIRAETRVNLLGNRLVLVAPRGRNPVPLTIGRGFALGRALGSGRLAVADPAVVPAGKYAKAALTSLGVWDAVATRLAPAENVRAALLLVSRGEAPLGIVYRTDAAADPGVEIVDTFPASTHPPIIYPAALTRASTGATPGAVSTVFDCIRGPVASSIFERWGFGLDAPALRR